MLIKVMRVDSTGLFIEDVLLEDEQEVPPNCIAIIVPEGFYLPRWNGTVWIEGLTQAEIDAIKNRVVPKTNLELLKDDFDIMYAQMLMLQGVTVSV